MNLSFLRVTRSAAACLLAIALLLSVSCGSRKVTITPYQFTYQPALVPNPMKGFASFYREKDEKIPTDSSLEYVGLKFSEICTWENGKSYVNPEALDPTLEKIANRGHNAILRVYMLYPGYNTEDCTGLFLPEALYEAVKSEGGIYVGQYQGSRLEYPNFNNETLLTAMIDFIHAFGKQFVGKGCLQIVGQVVWALFVKVKNAVYDALNAFLVVGLFYVLKAIEHFRQRLEKSLAHCFKKLVLVFVVPKNGGL